MNLPLPAYLDPDAWQGFCDMRRAMPKSRPFTTRAAVLILKELQRIKDAGHCPNAALDQSTMRGWAGVWVAEERAIEGKPGLQADETARYLAEQKSRPVADSAKVAQLVQRAKQNMTRAA